MTPLRAIAIITAVVTSTSMVNFTITDVSLSAIVMMKGLSVTGNEFLCFFHILCLL